MIGMKCSGIAIAAATMLVFAAPAAVFAQNRNQNPVFVPGQPAPIPVPPPPPSNPQPPGAQPKLDTFGDRAARCLHYGSTAGLPPGQREAYVRSCANN
jgi:hypothetical protein